MGRLSGRAVLGSKLTLGCALALVGACGNLKPERHDRRLFEKHRAEFESLAGVLRRCPEPVVINAPLNLQRFDAGEWRSVSA